MPSTDGKLPAAGPGRPADGLPRSVQVQGADVFCAAMEEHLADVPSPLEGVAQIQQVCAPDDVAWRFMHVFPSCLPDECMAISDDMFVIIALPHSGVRHAAADVDAAGDVGFE